MPGDGYRQKAILVSFHRLYVLYLLSSSGTVHRLRQALVRKVVFEKIIYQQILPRVYMAAIASALNPDEGSEVI